MRALDDIIGFISNKLNTMTTFVTLVQLELRLAKLSVYPLFLTLCGMMLLSLTVWLLTLSLIGYGLVLACNNLFIALSCLLLFNLMLLYFVFYYFLFNLKLIRFEKTRNYIHSTSKQPEHTDDDPKKATHESNRYHERSTTKPTKDHE